MDFKTLPQAARLRLDHLTVPSCLLGQDGGLMRISLTIADGHITDGRDNGDDVISVDMGGAMVFPGFTDMHTHLDKGHIWPRAANPDGSFMGAIATASKDRNKHWTTDDIRRRMDFALRCAYAHGTTAIRTHLDSTPPQDSISWPIFREVRAEWAGRIALQAACLIGVDKADLDGAFLQTADIVAESGGVLGMVTTPMPDLRERLLAFFRIASARGLAVDFHADETGDPDVATLRLIAQAVLDSGFDLPVTVGHCCSLAVQDASECDRTLDLVAQAGLNIVSLPMCNLYLQARAQGRTPRWRGLTVVHEMKARGINVSFASDNTRDPFYAYGDLDMLEVMREATRIGHLDHSDPDWVQAFLGNPARACGFAAPSLAPGAPADLVITRARNWSELFSRPQSDRIVMRKGRAIDRTLPDYAELDDLFA